MLSVRMHIPISQKLLAALKRQQNPWQNQGLWQWPFGGHKIHLYIKLIDCAFITHKMITFFYYSRVVRNLPWEGRNSEDLDRAERQKQQWDISRMFSFQLLDTEWCMYSYLNSDVNTFKVILKSLNTLSDPFRNNQQICATLEGL